MKIKYTIAALLLVLVMMVAACGNTETSAASPFVTTQLTEGGVPTYSIIYPYRSESSLNSMTEQMAEKISAQFGVNFPVELDKIKEDVAEGAVPELLVGKTDRPETRKVAESLGYNGYAVTAEGEKVVIYGNTSDAQQKAVDAFLAALSQNESGEIVLTLPVGGIIEAGEQSFFGENDPAEYVIVYDAENKGPARALQTAIRQAYGYELPLRTADEAEVEKEILVGTCGRQSAEAALHTVASPVGYKIKLDAQKIVIVGKSAFATKQAVEYFRDDFVDNGLAVKWQLPSVMEYCSSALAGAEYTELTEGADIRIMSFNVLTELWNQKLPVEGRDEIVASMLLTYLPDVIGWQEVSDKWYERLVPMVEDQYTFVNPQTPAGKTNYSALAYNSAKVKLITSGCELYSKGNSRNMRLMNWAVFETIEGGKRFVLINTHLDPHSDDQAVSARLVQANEMAEKVKVMREEYGCPVIITGDYNCARNSEEYKLFAERAGVKDAQWDSAEAVNNRYRTYHGVGSEAMSGETAIDHITYTEGVSSLFYINHNSSPTINASDHNPIMADFKFD